MRIVAVDTRSRYYVLVARHNCLWYKRLTQRELRRRGLWPPPLVENLDRLGYAGPSDGVSLIYSSRVDGHWLRQLRALGLLKGHHPQVQRIIDALILMEGA